ncbi:unnamed protein product [Prorocentrum cordatum]|uniref:Uncharacterized protein n=1 Tax=Prorocentrum cordatum TaxID=2364126 RepID=A0ABN9WZR2_9DINO|nr:unnamed protein product [Polarella glacialis]
MAPTAASRGAALAALAAIACGLVGCGDWSPQNWFGGSGEDAKTVCEADPTQACKCILGAHVFSDIEGCSPDACDSPAAGLKELIDGCAEKAKSKEAQCEEITNLMQCATETGCTGPVLTASCQHIVLQHPDCPVDCGGAAPRAGGLGLATAVAALLAAKSGLEA